MGPLEVFFGIGDSSVQIAGEDKSVVNLSTTVQLTPAHFQLLRRGLSFIPTATRFPETKKTFSAHLGDYHRRLKLLTYYGPSTASDCPPFQPKSTWQPPASFLPGDLLTLIDKDIRDVARLCSRPEKGNLTREELRALQELRKLDSVVIKPADKGSAVVIMDKADYIQEAQRQLQDSNYYRRLSVPMYPVTAIRVHSIINTLVRRGFLSKKQAKYLRGAASGPRPRYFYLLPKIHKPRVEWPAPGRIPPGRPIISDCGSESYGVAEYIDYFLNPLSITHRSYVKDTNDFVAKVKSLPNLPASCFLFSMDVVSLYTNLDTQMGMSAVRRAFRNNPDRNRPDEQLLELLHINLACNDFEFNKQTFLQVKGTAMGKRFSPAYANIYMADWEESVFAKCPKLPEIYLRYLDDIWGIWTYSREDFEQFATILNDHHPSINLKPVLHSTEINFLDTTVFKGPTFSQTGKLDIRVFFKPTDSHALLHKDSFHPRHTFRGIVHSQLLRFRRICTRQEDLEAATTILFRTLRNRGYSRTFLRLIRKQFLAGGRGESPGNPERPVIPMVSFYSSYAMQANWVLRANFGSLFGDTFLGGNCRVISSYRKNPNLRDLLVRARLPNPLQGIPPPRRSLVVTNFSAGKSFFAARDGTRLTTNCVYLLECRKCHKQYVGETGNSLRTRLYAHYHNIRRGRKMDTILVRHFRDHGLTNMKAAVLDSDVSWSRPMRLYKERCWITRLNSWAPRGLNNR